MLSALDVGYLKFGKREIMSQTASIEWWNKSLEEVGVHSMDKLVSSDSTWSAVLQSGREDLSRAMQITGMKIGSDRDAVEVGCGLGRMSASLADQFGVVVGVDIAPRLIKEARRRNEHPRVSFEVADGIHLRPESITQCDTVFSYEVFYYINPSALTTYFQDVFQLLRSGGELVFQLNLEPLRWTTRMSFLLRKILYAIGIKHWRGWPTGAGYRRYCHSPEWLRQTLAKIGFHVEKITGPTPRQMWVVAVKP